MIIGVTGTLGSGKGTFAKLVAERGFERLAFVDVVREEAERKGIEPNRENLQRIGYAAGGDGGVIWAQRLIERVGGNCVVDGFRYPEQVGCFRDRYGADFRLVAIDGPQYVRYDRLLRRGREGDPRNWAEFLEAERRDLVGYQDGTGQNVRGCFEVADLGFENGDELRDLAFRTYAVLNWGLEVAC